MNRDSAVKKIIYNFESILDAHNAEKNRNAEMREKYAERQNEINELRKINTQLSELLTYDQELKINQEEERMKLEIKELKFSNEQK